MKKLIITALLFINAGFASADATPADCSGAVLTIAQSIAAVTPNAKVFGNVRRSLTLTTDRPGPDGKIQTTQLDLDPYHPSRSYYIDISYPVPGPDGWDGKLHNGTTYRISFQDGRYSSPETAENYLTNCYVSDIEQIRTPH